MKYSIVVPCYNEEKNIPELVRHFSVVSNKLKKYGLELILVDNGSTDGTKIEIQKAINDYSWIRTVGVEINQGYGYGVLQGLKACKGEYLGYLHADLQIAPENLLKMVSIIEHDSLPQNIFFRGKRKNRPAIDRFFTFAMSVIETVYLKTLLYDINAQPTMFHRSFFNSLKNPPTDFSFDLYIYYMAKRKNLRIRRVRVYQSERTEGKSSWNTGMKSRIAFARKTLDFTFELKKNYGGKK